MGTFPPPALRTRRADFRHRALQWNHAARPRASRPRRAGGYREPWHQARTLAPAGRCVVRPVDALTTATSRVVPFAYACDDCPALLLVYGVIGVSHSREPAAFRHPFHLKLLPSASVTRPPRYYELLRHPGRPGLALTGCRLARATPPAGLPVLRSSPSSTRGAAITPAEPVGARVARFPTAGSLPRYPGGSASALAVSRPARRSLALRPVWSLSRPGRPVVVGVLQAMSLPPSSAPTATGWSDSCRAGFAPAEEWRLVTAHWTRRTTCSPLAQYPGAIPENTNPHGSIDSVGRLHNFTR